MREPILVFDIETIPDLDGGRRIHDLEAMDDAGVWAAMKTLRQAHKGNDFMPAHLQRVVAISVALRHGDSFRVWSIGDEDAEEGELIQRFFDGVEKYRPVLVSWNGGGFDLPVLHYRGLIHGCVAPRYWDSGQLDRETKWDNYISRYQFRHTDLMDVLAMYSGRQNAPLTEIAQLLGFPGKLGMDGSKVFDAYREGRLRDIRDYCETDVLNTYLVYLRFELMRGHLSHEAHTQEELRVRQLLEASDAPHWAEFLDGWVA
jgi:predicted PolB exonuclease-like 3'-5' exonuclease